MVIAHLLRLARAAAGLLLASTAARTLSLLCGAALLAVPAWAVGARIDVVAEPDGLPGLGGPVPGLGLVVALMVTLAAVKAVSRYGEQILGHVAAFRLLEALRVRLYDRLVPLAPAINEQGSGRLLAAATRDVDRVEVFFAHTLAPIVTAVLLPLVAVGVAAVVAGPAPAIVLAMAYLLGALLLIVVGRSSAGARERRLVGLRGRMTQEISDNVRGLGELTTLGAGEQRAARIDRLGTQIAEARAAQARPLAVRAGVQAGWQLAAILLLLAVGLPLVNDLEISMAALLVAVALVPGIAPALASVEAFAISLPAALASARNLRDLEEQEPAVADPADSEHLGAVRGDVHFERLRFRYPGPGGTGRVGQPAGAGGSGRPAGAGPGHGSASKAAGDGQTGRAVLRGLDLDVETGSVVAVVGASGSGKSTLARLLARVWDVEGGAVWLDGIDIRRVPLAELRQAVTVVDQRAVLLAGTLRENLLLVRPGAEDSELVAACETACLDLASFPEGLDTVLGEEGERLSGGQAQRLALARGYLRGAPVLVLDEVTSYQDPLTQREMLRRLVEFRAGRSADGGPTPLSAPRTVILIAHRGAVLQYVDRVHVLEEGRVVEAGAPAELGAREGAFARLMGR
ncbi:ATP-binding cassette subfamily C protein CydC [Bogoriella caseilytica]|uniref:ATP-binding cassette subfamily C protein CydC n=1 Tax=Bogoriella caseilytica TaxID=56055 RepID=A0A3N2BAQ4_9MICO|nr:ATP-binding cassette subfamily C protein CydC [Bogoriella caseilytica]